MLQALRRLSISLRLFLLLAIAGSATLAYTWFSLSQQQSQLHGFALRSVEQMGQTLETLVSSQDLQPEHLSLPKELNLVTLATGNLNRTDDELNRLLPSPAVMTKMTSGSVHIEKRSGSIQ